MTEITTIEAARLLGLRLRIVQRYCAAGRLRARRIGRMWLVDLASVREFRRASVGRPKKNLSTQP